MRCRVSRTHSDSDENVKSALILAVLFANNVFIKTRQGVTVLFFLSMNRLYSEWLFIYNIKYSLVHDAIFQN